MNQASNKFNQRSPWFWVPSLYYAQGIPYVVVMMVSVIMYKRLGISNSDIALYTSWLYLPWVIKPIWSPLVDLLKTKRWWIVTMQMIIGASLASVALTFPLPDFFRISLAFLWLMAFSSATHDIAADGFYLLGLDTHNQSWFVGIRSSFYRLAMISGQGLLVVLAGFLESVTGPESAVFQLNSLSPQSTIVESTPKIPSTNAPTIYVLQNEIGVPISQISPDERESKLTEVRLHNARAGFYGLEAARNAEVELRNKTVSELSANKESTKNSEQDDWLTSFLRKNFGDQKEDDETFYGSIAIAKIRLHDPLKETEGELIVNINREEGDASIKIVEGDRLVFDEANREKEAWVAFELDSKLRKEVQTTFIANAGNVRFAWSVTFGVVAALFIGFFFYHFFLLPKPSEDVPRASEAGIAKDFIQTFAAFFKRDKLGWVLAFLLLYRFAEAQIAKLASPFLLDSTASGGLGLTTGEVGFIYGTIGVAMLTAGGIIGGFLAARDGLKKWLWWMVIGINLPNLVYVYLSWVQPDVFWVVTLGVAIEQFGYGFGFTAYMLYCIYVSQGEHKTTHYAITTGFMALGMMLPGMFSGWLQEIIGYTNFFIWVVIATVPAFVVTAYIPLDPNFGKKTSENGTDQNTATE